VKTIAKIVAVVFLSGAVFFLAGSIGVSLNYLFQFYPGKISVELFSTGIYAFLGMLLAFVFFLLAWSLYRRKRWFIRLYWSSTALLFVCVVISSPLCSAHSYQDTLIIMSTGVVLLALGGYFHKHQSTFSN
jgi:hypothetical protein